MKSKDFLCLSLMV